MSPGTTGADGRRMTAVTYDLQVIWDSLDRLVTRVRRHERQIKGSKFQKLLLEMGNKTVKAFTIGSP